MFPVNNVWDPLSENGDDGQNEDELHDPYYDIMEVTPELLDLVDIQGFHWRENVVSRKDYRHDRNASIQAYQEMMNPRLEFCQHLASECIKTKPCTVPLYDFSFCTRRHPCSIYHFQLRHLLACPSAYDVCYAYEQKVILWNSVFNSSREISSFGPGQRNTKICTLTTTPSLVLIGGAASEVILQPIYESNPAHAVLLSEAAAPFIINHLRVTHDCQHAMICSNDTKLRFLDLETGRISKEHMTAVPMNCGAFHPDDRVYCVVGDDPQGLVCDIRTNQPFATLVGHLDHSFAVDFSCNGVHIATGNQDKTTRIYDMRKLSSSIACLQAHVGPVRNLCYSLDGSVLVAGESDDYVTLYDVSSGYSSAQVVDFFGEVSGLAFAPTTDCLYIGVASYDSGGLIKFRKKGKRPSGQYS